MDALSGGFEIQGFTEDPGKKVILRKNKAGGT